MRVEKTIMDYLEDLKIRDYAEGTIKNRRMYLEQFLFFLQLQGIQYIAQITKETIFDYRVKLSGDDLTILTLRDKLLVLRGFFSFLYHQSFLFYDLSVCISLPKSTSYLLQNILSEDEVLYFLSLPNTKFAKGIRDRAILEVLYSTGIRRAELVGVDLYDLNHDDNTLKVLGKGRKERIVPVGDTAIFWVSRYIKEVRNPQNAREQALFLGFISRTRLTPRMLNFMVCKYDKQSRLDKRVTPHTFRHTFATHLLKNGADVRYIQEMLGHSSPETTQLYARVEISDLKDVFQKSHPRATKRTGVLGGIPPAT